MRRPTVVLGQIECPVRRIDIAVVVQVRTRVPDRAELRDLQPLKIDVDVHVRVVVHIATADTFADQRTAVRIVRITLHHRTGAVHYATHVVHAIDRVIVRPIGLVVVHHQSLVDIADAVDVVTAAVARRVVLDDLAHTARSSQGEKGADSCDEEGPRKDSRSSTELVP
ncbi:MAG: hypothetical protein MI923_03530 [Phycisphaerales bacterium]|nr:hypothetical protein [Phycisphaerales bacterium]